MYIALKKELSDFIQSFIQEYTDFTLMELTIRPSKIASDIRLVIDRLEPFGVDDCGKLSQALYKQLEGSQLVENFELTISSPGVGEPLIHDFQYTKSIGRKVRIIASDGGVLEGKLVALSPDGMIHLEQSKKVKGKEEVSSLVVAKTDVKKTTVLVSFN